MKITDLDAVQINDLHMMGLLNVDAAASNSNLLDNVRETFSFLPSKANQCFTNIRRRTIHLKSGHV